MLSHLYAGVKTAIGNISSPGVCAVNKIALGLQLKSSIASFAPRSSSDSQ